ncbi:myb/SANT-like DNA-binding domain-containing protein 4 [Montipora capricornis]|uniref:myb/SANT-like DNA-binding domain-containing protein 4 n=1 Tax=Montipora capricornis TaxID=246305 RepID=UPI0035F1A2A8
MSETKKKSARFTEDMNRALIDGYTRRQVVLKSKFSNVVTNNCKKNAWEEITMAVNAVNSGERKTVDQVKKRWEDLTASVKRKERQAHQGEVRRLKVTGNGNLPDDSELSEDLHCPVAPAVSRMSSTEREVANVLGPQAFIGINGGTDTLETLWKEGINATVPLVPPTSQEYVIENETSSSSSSSARLCEASVQSLLMKDVQDIDEVVEVSIKPIRKGKKRTLADAQLEYFEVATSYYKLKMEKVKLEMELLMKKQKEE